MFRGLRLIIVALVAAASLLAGAGSAFAAGFGSDGYTPPQAPARLTAAAALAPVTDPTAPRQAQAVTAGRARQVTFRATTACSASESAWPTISHVSGPAAGGPGPKRGGPEHAFGPRAVRRLSSSRPSGKGSRPGSPAVAARDRWEWRQMWLSGLPNPLHGYAENQIWKGRLALVATRRRF